MQPSYLQLALRNEYRRSFNLSSGSRGKYYVHALDKYQGRISKIASQLLKFHLIDDLSGNEIARTYIKFTFSLWAKLLDKNGPAPPAFVFGQFCESTFISQYVDNVPLTEKKWFEWWKNKIVGMNKKNATTLVALSLFNGEITKRLAKKLVSFLRRIHHGKRKT